MPRIDLENFFKTLDRSFDGIEKSFVGIDRMMDRFGSFADLAKTFTQPGTSQSNYPPYNITKTSESTYEIEVALAGFKQDDIEITHDAGQLTVKGNVVEKTPDDIVPPSFPEEVHHGIARRSFTRTFTIDEDLVVDNASFDNGLLTIKLSTPPKQKGVSVPINAKPQEKSFLAEDSVGLQGGGSGG